MIENENVHITDSFTIYQELVQYQENFMENSKAFMKGNYVLSFVKVAKLKSSPIFAALTKDWEHDAKVVACLQVYACFVSTVSATIQRLSSRAVVVWKYQVCDRKNTRIS
ncbi:hypothetical protein DPMN_055238 [Dreissena polymorpha]|uniref:Uncharacterized protein n=1 Tax=Dreissena polymorpha TaxID=45954 RepID=A0A9D4CR10_DREPO|nr:hypothetical protein DPMN_055238 [Dreissena polymorpha]